MTDKKMTLAEAEADWKKTMRSWLVAEKARATDEELANVIKGVDCLLADPWFWPPVSTE